MCIVLAAVLWSLSGGFAKVLTQTTALGLDSPRLSPLPIAFYRALFAGLFLLPALRRQDIGLRPMMLVMVASFAIMNALFITALTQGTAANAILLQYTAPMWMYLASIWLLGEAADRRSSWALAIGLTGIGIIIWGSWEPAQLYVVAIGLGSGVAYAAVVLCLRVLRQSSSRWLTVLNHLVCAVILLPWIWQDTSPSSYQLAVLVAFGVIQMGLPYWLMARGLRSVSAQEAGTITLLEPLLNPLWAFLVAGERPALATLAGGVLILGALIWRYWPSGQHVDKSKTPKPGPDLTPERKSE
jgi:drug/metabolite transporter (DMT)-like permease